MQKQNNNIMQNVKNLSQDLEKEGGLGNFISFFLEILQLYFKVLPYISIFLTIFKKTVTLGS